MYKNIYDELEKLEEEYTRSEIANLKDLDEIFASRGITELLKKEVESFFNILSCEEYKNMSEYRRQQLHQTQIIKIFSLYDYTLSKYLKNDLVLGTFPMFMLESAKKFDIPVYKDMTFKEILYLLNDNLDLVAKYIPYWKRDYIRVLDKERSYKYDEYLEEYEPTRLDDEPVEIASITAEFMTFYDEEANLPYGGKIIFTAKELGDGYGYDVYTYNPITKRESLIEVKSTKTNKCDLTLNEYKTMLKTINQPYTDYYLHIYAYKEFGDEFDKYVLKYDKERNIFIDIENNREYKLEPRIDTDNKELLELEMKLKEEKKEFPLVNSKRIKFRLENN